jgi:ABC-type bacteriocin/lantibiotic exporter with double-glycine peptidase domain
VKKITNGKGGIFVKFLCTYIFSEKYILVLIITLVFLTSLLNLPIPYFTKFIIDDVLIDGNLSILFKIVFVTCIIVLLQMTIGILISYFTSKFTQNIISSMRINLHKKIIFSINPDTELVSNGQYQTVIFNDSEIIGQGLQEIILGLFSNILLLIMYFTILFNMNIKLTFIAFFSLPIFILIVKLFGNKLQKLSLEVQISKDGFFSTLIENLSGRKSILIYNAFKNRNNIFVESISKVNRNSVRLTTLNSFLVVVISIISLIGPFSVLIYGTLLVKEKQLTAGELITIYSYVGLIYPHLTELINIIPKFKILSGPLTRVYEILSKIERRTNQFETPITNGCLISLKDITFSNHNNIEIFNKLSIEINSGEKILLTGKNGSGKTTFLEILMKLRPIQSGNIYINNIDILNTQTTSLSEFIAYVPQDTHFFSGSILDNLTIGLDHYDQNKLIELIKIFNLYDDIYALEENIHTKFDKVLTNLSSGQIQKIKIIRSLLQNPKLFLIDEALSNIDEPSLKIILKYLNENFFNMTVIIVSNTQPDFLLEYIDKVYKIEDKQLLLEFTKKIRNKDQQR